MCEHWSKGSSVSLTEPAMAVARRELDKLGEKDWPRHGGEFDHFRLTQLNFAIFLGGKWGAGLEISAQRAYNVFRCGKCRKLN